MNRTLLIAPVLVLAAGALHLVERRGREAEISRLRTDFASLSSTVDGVRKSAAEGGARRAGPLITVVAPAAAESAAPREASARREDTSREEAASKFRDHLETSFAAEHADPRWSRGAQSAAQTRLVEAAGDASSVQSVDCRTSMCRIETAHPDSQSYRKFIEAAFMNPQDHLWGGAFYADLAADPSDGKLAVVLYVPREGESLPGLR